MEDKLIRSPGELPEWFITKDYNIPNRLNTWAYEINARFWLKLSLHSMDKEKGEEQLNFFLMNKGAPFGIHPLYDYLDIESSVGDLTIFDVIALKTFIWKQKYEEIAQSLKEVVDNSKAYYDSKFDFVSDGELKEILGTRGLGSASEFIFQDSLNLDNDPLDSDNDSAFDIFFCPAFLDYEEYNHLIGESLILSGRPITVDLSFDDKTIIEDLKKWLKNNRKNGGKITKNPYTEKDMNDWRKYKILQVFDLDTWSKFHGIKITDATIAKVLWPDDDPDSEAISPIDRLRKVTRKKIIEIMNPIAVRKLLAQGSAELTREQNIED